MCKSLPDVQSVSLYCDKRHGGFLFKESLECLVRTDTDVVARNKISHSQSFQNIVMGAHRFFDLD